MRGREGESCRARLFRLSPPCPCVAGHQRLPPLFAPLRPFHPHPLPAPRHAGSVPQPPQAAPRLRLPRRARLPLERRCCASPAVPRHLTAHPNATRSPARVAAPTQGAYGSAPPWAARGASLRTQEPEFRKFQWRRSNCKLLSPCRNILCLSTLRASDLSDAYAAIPGLHSTYHFDSTALWFHGVESSRLNRRL